MDASEERARYADVLSTVSHDIRGPLGVILVAVSELLDPRVGPLTDEQRMVVQLVRRSGERLARLAANVSFLERASGGSVPLSRQPTDLRDIARRAIDSFERSGEIAKQLRVALHVPPERVTVNADVELATQALTNVLANAIRAARLEVAVTVTSDAGEAALLVDDDGPGISPHLQVALFETDRGTDSAPARGREPRGLGLVVVRGIISAHGGALSAATRVDPAGRPLGMRVKVVFGAQL